MASDVKWIKITTDIFDDEKILLIESLPDSYAIITVWFKLLCLAGKQNNSGVFMMGQMPYTDTMLATIFRMKEATVKMALDVFANFGMVEIIDGVITIPNWGKHQNIDQLESKKEYMRGYMKEYREKQKLLASGESSKTNCKTNSKTNVSRTDKEREEEKEGDKEVIDVSQKRKRFAPPTLEEVKAYCKERGDKVDPQRFYDYFTASNWHDSEGRKVISWKQKVITWERFRSKNDNADKSDSGSFDTDDFFEAAIARSGNKEVG